VGAFDNGGRNALMEASSNGHTRIARLLLEHGVDVNAQGNSGRNALAEAAASYKGHTRMLQLLLDNGAYDMKSSGMRSAVERASWYGHSEAVELLLERCADVYTQDTCFVNKALQSACRMRRKQTIKLLLSKGADMYGTDYLWGLFRKGVKLGHQGMAKTLLEGAYVTLESNAPNEYGTIVNFCASVGHTKYIQFVYESFKTNVHVSGPHGKTPLHFAAESGRMETFEYLITLGADPAGLDAKGDGILCYATMGGHLEMTNAILNKELGSERYSIHWSPLHWACRVGCADMVELLLEKGLRSHLITTDELEGQWSPLDVAIYAGQEKMLERLLVTSRSLLGIDPGPEKYSSKVLQKSGRCYGCSLVSSPKTISDFINIKVAISWAIFSVYHMLPVSSLQWVLRIRWEPF
jgi:ankyrin repeat protein